MKKISKKDLKRIEYRDTQELYNKMLLITNIKGFSMADLIRTAVREYITEQIENYR